MRRAELKAARLVGLAAWLALAQSAPARAVEPSPRDPPADAVLAELPFLDAGGRPAVWIDLAPAGHARRLPLVLDTGASHGYVTPRLARALGVKVRPTKETPYRRATLLGRDFQFRVDARRSDTAGPTSWEVGLLGGDFLAHYVVEIDSPARRVRFLDPARYRVAERSGEGEIVLPLRLVGNRPFVEAEVQGARVRLLLDTGAELGLLLGRRVAEQSGLRTRALLGLQLQGVSGKLPIGVAEVAELRLGMLRLVRLPALVLERSGYQMLGAADSALGHELLAGFRLRIDYPRRRVALARGDAGPARFFGDRWDQVRQSGLVLAPLEGGARVKAVLEGSPAARLGLAPAERLGAPGAGPGADDTRAAIHDVVIRGEQPTRRDPDAAERDLGAAGRDLEAAERDPPPHE